MSSPKPAIVGIKGLELTREERDFFQTYPPYGFILFARNCESSSQIKKLTHSLRECVGRQDMPILIDQEGGPIVRLPKDQWHHTTSFRSLGELYERDPEAAKRLARETTQRIAMDLRDLGINVNCSPVLDLYVEGAHPIIGQRAFSSDPAIVIALGAIVIETFKAHGIIPIMKHIPGHGLATLDSHEARPTIDQKDLEDHFAPFKALAPLCPWAMTAHITYSNLDPHNVATHSKIVIDEIIRKKIGFKGFLVSDDLTMKALEGSLRERALKALAAGCDAVLHWNGNLDEMEEILAV